MRKVETFFKEYVNAPILIFNGASFKKSLPNLLSVYDNTLSGDLVIVKSGTYNLANASIQLKNGVNWQFLPAVTISSSSVNGTFYVANGDSVITHWEGKPTILNSNGFIKHIVFPLGSLSLYGYSAILSMFLNSDSGTPELPIIYINDFEEVPTFTWDSPNAVFFLTFSNTILLGSSQHYDISILMRSRVNTELTWQADIGSFSLSQISFNNYSDTGVTTGDCSILMKLEVFYHHNL